MKRKDVTSGSVISSKPKEKEEELKKDITWWN